jgi:hypothetical protein
MSSRRSAVIPAILLILLGAWLLAQNLGVPLVGWDKAWPGVLVAVGLAFLAQFFLGHRQESGLLFTGVAAALLGAFFLAFTLGAARWQDMGRYWPVLVLIASAAFFAQWFSRPSERGLLAPAFLALAVGGVALPITLRVVNPRLVDLVFKFWPVGLILVGVVLLVGLLPRRKA